MSEEGERGKGREKEGGVKFDKCATGHGMSSPLHTAEKESEMGEVSFFRATRFRPWGVPRPAVLRYVVMQLFSRVKQYNILHDTTSSPWRGISTANCNKAVTRAPYGIWGLERKKEGERREGKG